MGEEIRVEMSGTADETESEAAVVTLLRDAQPLFRSDAPEGQSQLRYLLEKESPAGGASRQGITSERKAHPFRMDMTSTFQTVNTYHGRCLHAKVGTTVGLGFETDADRKIREAKRSGSPEPMIFPDDRISKVDTVLNSFCEHSWQDLITDVCEDYWQTGNGYIEVVRRDPSQGSPIVGLFHIPAPKVYVVIENDRYDRHYEIESDESSGARKFAKFGDLDGFLLRLKEGTVDVPGGNAVDMDRDNPSTSEVIHFRRPTSLSRWYGFPDWLAAVAAIELMQCVTQHNYDFFLNRGVPEFLLFILGQKLSKKDSDKIQTAMRATIGLGKSHKSIMLNLQNPEVKVQLEKLALESKSDGSQFAGMSDNLALQIVSAHGVPPLLAGIQIPGKLGATNELVQALTAFHALVVSPAQRIFEQKLRNTLGLEGTLELTAADLTLNKITDKIDMGTLDTVSRMRQSPQEASADGRDLKDGVLKEHFDAVLAGLVAAS